MAIIVLLECNQEAASGKTFPLHRSIPQICSPRRSLTPITARMAQLVERMTSNHEVRGSSPRVSIASKLQLLELDFLKIVDFLFVGGS